MRHPWPPHRAPLPTKAPLGTEAQCDGTPVLASPPHVPDFWGVLSHPEKEAPHWAPSSHPDLSPNRKTKAIPLQREKSLQTLWGSWGTLQGLKEVRD